MKELHEKIQNSNFNISIFMNILKHPLKIMILMFTSYISGF
jgi:hypothetical protein